MQRQPTLPTFGAIVTGAGGRLGAIMRGSLAGSTRAPDYAVIVAEASAKGTLAGDRGKLPWGKYDQDVAGAASLTDGYANTIAMAAAGCAGAIDVRAMVLKGHSDWYIPSRAELWALRANVPELFSQEWHWSSTQDSRNYAFVQVFAYGNSNWNGKDFEFRVRAVRRIQLHHFTA